MINKQDKSSRMGMLMSRDEGKEMFTWMDKDGDKFVDLLDWNELVSDHRKFSDIFVVPHPEVGRKIYLFKFS